MRVAGGKVVHRRHQLDRFDLPHRLHLSQQREHGRVDRLVLEHLGDFGTHAVEQRALGLDPFDINIEGPGEFFFEDPALDRLDDHVVLLDRGQPIDPLVVGEGLVVIGNQARRLARAEVHFARENATCRHGVSARHRDRAPSAS
jgi:hypothetical protein